MTKKKKAQLHALHKNQKGSLHPSYKKIDDSLHYRIMQLALRGFSPYVISIQLKAEGALIHRGKIKRLIDAENKKRHEAALTLIATNKRMKGPFISNIRF